jgi:hypothetical protein
VERVKCREINSTNTEQRTKTRIDKEQEEDSDHDLIAYRFSRPNDKVNQRESSLAQLLTPLKLAALSEAAQHEKLINEWLALTVTIKTRLLSEDVRLPLLDMNERRELIRYPTHYITMLEEATDMETNFYDYMMWWKIQSYIEQGRRSSDLRNQKNESNEHIEYEG